MAAPHPHTGPVGPDTPITVKVIIDGTNRRFKLPLRDLGANVFPQKLRSLLAIPPEQEVRFDRFSDSAGSYITLDSNNPAIYKQLYRAAKAKLKLRLKATVERKPVKEVLPQVTAMDQKKPTAPLPEPRNTFLETVLSQPSVNGAAPSFKSFQKTCQYSPKCSIPGAFDLDVNHAEQPPQPTSLYGTKDIYSLPTLPQMSDFPSTSYTIDCNHCGSSVPNEHYHCGICEGGDFDLCKTCIDAGITCDGDEHWLLKRTIRNGVVIPSTTETLPPKKLSKSATEDLVTPISPEQDGDDLTCNSCICQMPAPGDKHPGHRFAPIYTPIKIMRVSKPTHRGIYCDGPLCTSYKGYITGERYKCAVCHDTDFCANCEALPSNGHNASHPLIKMKLPIRHVSITTQHEDESGQKIAQLGDRPLAKHAATETTRSSSANAATQVQTVAEVSPAENAPTVPEIGKSIQTMNDLQAWYVSDSTPDGTKVAPNHFVSQSWTLRNPGPDAWPAGCAVYYIGGDDMRNLDVLHPSSVSAMTMANRSNVLASALEPGKTAVFTVLLKSPAREGRAISYWRLKTPGGVPFGHKLWVDIEVRSTPVELPIRTHILPTAPVAVDPVDEVVAEDKSQDSSTMIFPKLEKESPVSSVHDVREEQVEEAPAAVMEPTTKTEEQELLEDVESLELEESDSDDEEFLTDEEYDILDASDEDFEGYRPVAK
ncbi:hypothetical protein H2200_004640 [Cladophialophora chaetospira]|uniref:ZZ-type domain-containing protein n=1 Tax=Cladophialophora chaetospira TaxID=386627 RepID=A0AA38XDH0_9EURO|nr:hypothetical protein H2200_004640 [Cladophialophora chaetospira]